MTTTPAPDAALLDAFRFVDSFVLGQFGAHRAPAVAEAEALRTKLGQAIDRLAASAPPAGAAEGARIEAAARKLAAMIGPGEEYWPQYCDEAREALEAATLATPAARQGGEADRRAYFRKEMDGIEAAIGQQHWGAHYVFTKMRELVNAALSARHAGAEEVAAAWQYRDLRPGMPREWKPTTEAIYWSHLNGCTTGIKDVDWQVRALYTAPPAREGVPEERPGRKWASDYEKGFDDGWNECRERVIGAAAPTAGAMGGEDGVWMPRAPTIPMLLCLRRGGAYPDDWERGKQMQREYGFDVVPPECNTEIAAGQYARLLDLAARTREDTAGEAPDA